MSGVIAGQIRQLFDTGPVSGLGEGALLERFVGRGDSAAFEAILSRHGPMVLGVCRRLLRDANDVDDAFQATFLVLVRRADSLRRREALGPWLHGVAHRVAVRARGRSTKRRVEPLRADPADSRLEPLDSDLIRGEACVALHEELARLPERYRAPLVLCHLQGLTHDEAAARLSWPVGTVRGRLARGRDTLRQRLQRRGFGPLGFPPPFLPPVPPALASAVTISARAIASSGSLLALGSSSAAELTRGILHAMSWNTWKAPVMGMALFATLGTGMALSAGDGPGQSPRRREPVPQGKPAESDTSRSPFDLSARKTETEREGRRLAPRNLPEGALPSLKEEDTTLKIRALRDQYDANLARLHDERIRARVEVEVLEARVEATKQSLRDVTMKRDERLTIERDELERSLRELIEKVEQAKANRELAERAHQDLARRPRPSERVEVRIGDHVLIEVLVALPGRPISGERFVRADGTVSLGFYGDLFVAGLTPIEVKEKVIHLLRKALDDETLGLIEVVDPETAKWRMIAPRESGRVCVDILEDARPRRND